MSIVRIKGRNRRSDIFTILPFMLKKMPELEPVEIMGKDFIKSTSKKELEEMFHFIAVPQKVRDVIYSIEIVKYRCLYCGSEFEDIGNQFNKIYNNHYKRCTCPIFVLKDDSSYISIHKGKDETKKQKPPTIKIRNSLTKNTLLFLMKMRYISEKHHYIMELMLKDLKKMRNSNSDTIKMIFEKYSEWVSIKCMKNGRK